RQARSVAASTPALAEGGPQRSPPSLYGCARRGPAFVLPQPVGRRARARAAPRARRARSVTLSARPLPRPVGSKRLTAKFVTCSALAAASGASVRPRRPRARSVTTAFTYAPANTMTAAVAATSARLRRTYNRAWYPNDDGRARIGSWRSHRTRSSEK